MAMTNAERQARWRERRDARIKEQLAQAAAPRRLHEVNKVRALLDEVFELQALVERLAAKATQQERYDALSALERSRRRVRP